MSDRDILSAALAYIKHIGANHTMRGQPHPQQQIVDGLESILARPEDERRCWTGNPCGTDTISGHLGPEMDCAGGQQCYWRLRQHVLKSREPQPNAVPQAVNSVTGSGKSLDRPAGTAPDAARNEVRE